MLQWIYIACHGVVTITGLFGVWIKLEHRLTKIETDMSWLKKRMNPGKFEMGCAGNPGTHQEDKE